MISNDALNNYNTTNKNVIKFYVHLFQILTELLQENNTPSSRYEIQQTCNDQEDPALVAAIIAIG